MLYLTAIPLRSIAASELDRWAERQGDKLKDFTKPIPQALLDIEEKIKSLHLAGTILTTAYRMSARGELLDRLHGSRSIRSPVDKAISQSGRLLRRDKSRDIA